MSTNPNNAIGTNGAFGGRTSVNAFNDVLGVFKSRGIVSGWGIVPDSGMDVAVGGDGSTRDVAIAEDNIGNKTTVNNISQQPVTVSIPAAPASNSRIDLIVAYVDNPAQGVATETDNYGACGLIVVSGATAANPVAPDESDIRTAITTDGGAGSVAYYVVLGSVTVASGTTDISSNMISAGAFAAVKSDNVDCVYREGEQKIGTWIDGKPLYRNVYKSSNFATSYTVLTNGIIDKVVKVEALVHRSDYNNIWHEVPSRIGSNLSVDFGNIVEGVINFSWGSNWSSIFDSITIMEYYTKKSDR